VHRAAANGTGHVVSFIFPTPCRGRERPPGFSGKGCSWMISRGHGPRMNRNPSHRPTSFAPCCGWTPSGPSLFFTRLRVFRGRSRASVSVPRSSHAAGATKTRVTLRGLPAGFPPLNGSPPAPDSPARRPQGSHRGVPRSSRALDRPRPEPCSARSAQGCRGSHARVQPVPGASSRGGRRVECGIELRCRPMAPPSRGAGSRNVQSRNIAFFSRSLARPMRCRPIAPRYRPRRPPQDVDRLHDVRGAGELATAVLHGSAEPQHCVGEGQDSARPRSPNHHRHGDSDRPAWGVAGARRASVSFRRTGSGRIVRQSRRRPHTVPHQAIETSMLSTPTASSHRSASRRRSAGDVRSRRRYRR